MKPPENWEEIIDGKRYSTKTAVLIARGIGEHMNDPHNWNIFLYRTPDNSYFKMHLYPAEIWREFKYPSAGSEGSPSRS